MGEVNYTTDKRGPTVTQVFAMQDELDRFRQENEQLRDLLSDVKLFLDSKIGPLLHEQGFKSHARDCIQCAFDIRQALNQPESDD